MARQLKRAVIRLQTVTTLPTEYANDGGHPTIGETIDDLIRHHTAKGQIPNKLVLDLNPPVESNPADIGDTFAMPD